MADAKKPAKQKPELPQVDIDVPDITYTKQDHIRRGINDQKVAFKKKYGDNWKAVANGIIHVHTTHRKDYTADK